MSNYSEKQLEYWRNANKRWNIKSGAVRSGKTYMDYFMIPRRVRACKGNGHIFLLGNTKSTLQRNIIEPMQNIYGSLVGDIGSDNSVWLFGKKAYALGADKANQVSKLQGAGIEYCYGDEITTWNQEVFSMLKSRLDKPSSCFDGTCNPDNPNHWFKEFLDSDVDLYHQHYVIDDNPYNDPFYVQELKREYMGTVYYDRFILGKWTLAAGLIYPNFKKDSHVVPAIDREYTEFYVSNDYGTQHPCIFHLYGLCDGVWYQVKEYHHDGSKSGQKTVEEYYNDLLKFTEGYDVKQIYLDNAPIASSFNIHLRRQGYFNSKLADNQVDAGIQSVASALNTGKLKINDCCKETIKEFGSYSWKPKSLVDEPIKKDDDNMDCLRYFAKTKRIVSPPRRNLI